MGDGKEIGMESGSGGWATRIEQLDRHGSSTGGANNAPIKVGGAGHDGNMEREKASDFSLR
jgi:hypothetical protein